jgi:AmiR/NasT family two-component response regulator
MPNNDQRAPRAEVPEGTSEDDEPRPTAETVILGGNEETRLLLRGLLRLHRYRVCGEARTAEELDSVGDPRTRRVLVLVADHAGPDWADELVVARSRQVGLLPLLIVSEITPQVITDARAAGVVGLLGRPFAIRDLMAAVDSVGRGEERYPTPHGQK